MLPDSPGRKDRPGKYADTAIPLLLKELSDKGSKTKSLIAKMAGGACMFEYFGTNLNIGERNAERVRAILKENNIPLKKGRCRGKSRQICHIPSRKWRQDHHTTGGWNHG